MGQLEPMLAQTQQNLVDAGVTAKVGVLLADAGYCSEDNLLPEGPELLIATVKDWKQRRAATEAKPLRGADPQGPQPPPAHGAQAGDQAGPGPLPQSQLHGASKPVRPSGRSRTPATTS
jgi:hypothetical protein